MEFVQLARPTLSLAKYLQQVGRGLRKSDNKESCVLIDNVGLHRIFGLPVRDRDWEAMFEGRMAGNAQPQTRMENSGLSVSCSLSEDSKQNEGLEIVMTHNCLLDAIRKGDLICLGGGGPVGGEQRTALKACHDRQSGLWGLRCGNKITVIPQYREVFDICANRAAVRFEDGRTGVVDDSGTPLMVTDRCRRLRFLKGELLSVTKEDGSDCYTDLKTNRTYQERPVVFSYGGIELLRVGETFHSRTRKAYTSMHGLHKDSLCFYGFYLKIPDYRVPKSCRLVDPVWSAIFDVFACVLEGDDEEVYWCCGCLADRSIVVMDGEGNYYHVEKGKGKRYIACNAPKAGEADFASVVEGLRKEAGRRAESVQRERQQNEEEKRRKRLEEIKDVLPFRMGMKWGLKWGDRIVVPPCYRNICIPVGGYCAFEGNACQWGVMALDGKVVVEARYQKVEIEKDGTVHLTIIPGKVKTINL